MNHEQSDGFTQSKWYTKDTNMSEFILEQEFLKLDGMSITCARRRKPRPGSDVKFFFLAPLLERTSKRCKPFAQGSEKFDISLETLYIIFFLCQFRSIERSSMQTFTSSELNCCYPDPLSQLPFFLFFFF